MDQNRISGNVKNMVGKAEEGVGSALGDTKTQVEGVYKQAEGAVQDLYGQAKDTAESVRSSAVSLEDTLRSTIEDRPYTAVAAALFIGWLIGRSGRPAH
jgi:uncharacterized protein YjbJ (UPF0337 family)